MLDKMKQLYDMQKQAKQMQKSVEAIKIERTAGGVTVVMNGAFQVESIVVGEALLNPSQKTTLEKHLKEVLNAASDEAGKKSAEQTMSLMKGMNFKLPGF